MGVLVGGAGCLRLLAARLWTDRSRHDRQVRPDPRPRQWVHYRLDLLARGEATPLNDREQMFVRARAMGLQVRPADFVLSEPLLRLEAILASLDEDPSPPEPAPA